LTGRENFTDLNILVITVLSGVINSILTNPIWFINTRMSLAKEKKGIIQTVKDIYREEGLYAFYKGVLPNMILVTNPVINFVIYENLKRIMLKKKFSMNFLQLFLISSIGKGLATVATYPVLTVRVRMQTTKDNENRGVIPFILKIVRDLGFEGLYQGFYAKLF
jgi:solute carrier family 25 (peroxisomal adenine nucleotide transporter), member 17